MTPGDGLDPGAEPSEDAEAPELFRPRPGDDIVEPLFAGLRDAAPDPEEEPLVPREGLRARLYWRLRLLLGRRRR